jgi:glycolate oxidase FAD binding subunit
VSDASVTLAEQLLEARASGQRLRVCGARSKPWMATANAQWLDLSAHRGVVSYKPAELVVVVRAGTPLAELDAVLAEKNQMLAMEAPDFNGCSTIGGAVALGWAGSRGVFAQGVRDSVLGVRMLNGEGELLRFGGEVMKNVAGFDVSRLMVGSNGLLGALLELSLKVQPRPVAEITLGWDVPDLAETRQRVAEWTRRGLPISGASLEHGRFRARFSGPAAVLDDLAKTLGGEPEDGVFWEQLRRLERPLFHHGWGDEKLFDANGQICWTAHSRRQGEGATVSLAQGPDLHKSAHRSLLTRVASAFDPAGVFAAALA